MKIAYLITVYQDPAHLIKLIPNIEAPNVDIYIHIDEKSRTDFPTDFSFLQSISKIFLTDQNYTLSTLIIKAITAHIPCVTTNSVTGCS